ncbi:Phosphate acetyltransferase [Buchnera aphidicola (Phyllaphis fagi)]|uniref:phosphate acetyltransferase n=1 Tax=Buchnera aphidicola TaxID=9 RepID=UPI0034643559
MKRTIMLIPVSKNIGLTTISLGLIDFFEKLKLDIVFFKPFYESRVSPINLDDTSFILNKYFSTPFINSSNINQKFFILEKLKKKYLLKKSISLYLNYKKYYDILLIEGIKSNNSEYNSIHHLNLDLAYHINSDIIFILSNDKSYNIDFFLNKIKNLKIKSNILGIIINNIFLNYQEIYIKNIKKNKIYKNEFENTNHIPIIGNILWNKDLVFFPIIKMFQSFQVHKIVKINFNVNLVKLFILYNDLVFDYKIDYSRSIIIIPYDIFLKKFIHIINKKLDYLNFYAVLLTNVININQFQCSCLRKIKKLKISIFYTLLNINVIRYIITGFNLSILEYNYSQIKQSNNYIANFFNKKYILSKKLNTQNANYISSTSFIHHLKIHARKINKCILLPEGSEIRIIQAASIVHKLRIARCILLGNIYEIHQIALSNNIILSKNINIIDPIYIYSHYITRFMQLRYKKGITQDLAKSSIYHSNIVLGSLMLHSGEVDGVVCGVKYTSFDVLRSAFQIIGTNKKENISLVSSVFFMLLKDYVLVYGDCAININPNAQQLSEIAIQAADLSKHFGIEPRIAMLSYSTGLSSQGVTVEKVRKATLLIRKKRPDLIVDGPIQYDASINKSIAYIKSPVSPLLGSATVLIFPDLNSGNITYKAVQQSSKINSIGPILQGLTRPINDLSRGASINDIVYTIAVTAIQSNQKNIL